MTSLYDYRYSDKSEWVNLEKFPPAFDINHIYEYKIQFECRKGVGWFADWVIFSVITDQAIKITFDSVWFLADTSRGAYLFLAALLRHCMQINTRGIFFPERKSINEEATRKFALF
jgi:hypothetical protein